MPQLRQSLTLFDVTMIAKTTHHLFQPLLYQVATGILSEGEIAPPTRLILRKQRNAQVVLISMVHKITNLIASLDFMQPEPPSPAEVMAGDLPTPERAGVKTQPLRDFLEGQVRFEGRE